MITKEQLQKQLENLRLQLEQAKANMNAVNGAVQFCEMLISMAEEAENPMPE